MNEKLVVQLCEIILALAAVGGIAAILAATWHDMHAIANKARLRAIASSLSRSRRPSIVVVLYSYNNALTIETCLQSIIANDYGKYKIIIADNASTDMTMSVISHYKKEHSDIPITIHTQKRHIDRSTALKAAYKKIRKSDLALTLDATDQLSRAALHAVAAHFIVQPNLDALRIRQYFISDVTISTLPNYFITLSANMFNKAFSWLTLTYKNVDHSGTVIRSSTFLPSTFATKLSSAYDSTITFTPLQAAILRINTIQSRAIILLLIIGALTGIGMMTYFFYTAATLQSNTLLTLSWASVSLWLFAVIWSDDILKLSKRIALTFTIPFMYFIFYAQLFINLIKMIWRLFLVIPVPVINFKNIHDAILQEAYSTRF